jgi:hypothetical protein
MIAASFEHESVAHHHGMHTPWALLWTLSFNDIKVFAAGPLPCKALRILIQRVGRIASRYSLVTIVKAMPHYLHVCRPPSFTRLLACIVHMARGILLRGV